MFVSSSSAFRVTPMEAFEFYLWVFEEKRKQPPWQDFTVRSKSGNRLWFDAKLGVLGRTTPVSGVTVLSPERFIEFRIEETKWSLLRADPAVVRYAFQENRGTTLVTKTWHMMFQSVLRRSYEWAVALQLKRNLSSSFRFDHENLKAWSNQGANESVRGYILSSLSR